MFFLQQNNKGRSAADKARASGQADVMVWIDRNIKMCDPYEERFDESTMQIWREHCDDYYGLP